MLHVRRRLVPKNKSRNLSLHFQLQMSTVPRQRKLELPGCHLSFQWGDRDLLHPSSQLPPASFRENCFPFRPCPFSSSVSLIRPLEVRGCGRGGQRTEAFLPMGVRDTTSRKLQPTFSCSERWTCLDPRKLFFQGGFLGGVAEKREESDLTQ